MDNTTLAQTYVQHDGKWFFVSTINRPSSARLAPDLYYAETIVWTLDPETNKREKIIYQGGASQDSISLHQEVVARLYDLGVVIYE